MNTDEKAKTLDRGSKPCRDAHESLPRSDGTGTVPYGVDVNGTTGRSPSQFTPRRDDDPLLIRWLIMCKMQNFFNLFCDTGRSLFCGIF